MRQRRPHGDWKDYIDGAGITQTLQELQPPKPKFLSGVMQNVPKISAKWAPPT
jgi:hypothetical protein